MDNRAEIWLPLGLNPGQPAESRQPLPVSDRPAEGRRVVRQRRGPSWIRWSPNWGERVGVAATRLHQRRPPAADGAGAGSDRRQRQPRDLGAAGRGRLRAAHRLREPRQPAAGARRDAASRVRRAHGARRRPRPAAAAVHDRGRAAVGAGRRARAWCLRASAWRAHRAAYPDSLPRTSEVAVDPRVLLFTLGVSPGDRGRVRARAAPAHAVDRPRGRAEGRRRAGGDRRRASPRAPRAGDGGGGAGGHARDWRRPAAAHRLQPRHRGCRVRPVAARHVPGDAAARRIRPGARAVADVRAAARAAAGRPGHPGRVGDVRPAAEPAAQRQRHRHRQLHGARGRPVREHRLLPERHGGLLRDAGHPDRRGPRFPGR